MLTQRRTNQRARAVLIALSMLAALLIAVPASAQVVGFTQIAGGHAFSLALAADGNVWAWGENFFGQLGDGTQVTRGVPAQVPELTGVTAIAAGLGHSLALRGDGTVWTWGMNDEGQLGDGTRTTRFRPAQVTGITEAVAIAAGRYHSLAIRADGTVWAWGDNASGQLGDGTTSDRTTPVQVSGLTGVTAIDASAAHSVALRADNTAWAWGGNTFGQLGDGTNTAKTMPVPMSGATDVVRVAAGLYRSLFLRSNGTVWETGEGRATPAQVTGLGAATAITAGESSGLALRADGTVWSWGYDNYGQLGRGDDASYGPDQVHNLTGVLSINAGGYHSLALRNDGTIWAWGLNSKGQLGDGTTTDRNTPVQTIAPSFSTPPVNSTPAITALISPAVNATLATSGPHSFSVTASDPDDDRWRGQIDVATATAVPVTTLLTGEALSGGTATATAPAALSPGAYQWRARAIDELGGVGEYSSWSPFSVGSGSTVPVPSEDCGDGTTVADGYAGGTYVRLAHKQTAAGDTLVCFRVDGPSIAHGGRLTVSTAGTALPEAPSSDTNWATCSTQPGDADALPDPLLDGNIGEAPAGPVYLHVDAYRNADEAWFCLNVGNAQRHRVVIPLEPSAGTPNVNFLPDPPEASSPNPAPAPPRPSSTCQNASSNGAEYVNMDVGASHVWLASWQESPTKAHLCVRTDGVGSVGGRLTLDATGYPGVSPVVTTGSDPSACTSKPVDLNSPELRIWRSDSGANPAALCVKAAGGSWTVVRLGTSGSPNLALPAVWTPDPGTPA